VNARRNRILAGSLLAIVLGACSSAAAPSASPGGTPSAAPAATASPVATGAATEAPLFPIRAAAIPPQACMDALMGGKLARVPASGLGVATVDGGAIAVEWPFHYTAREVEGRIVLIDETGKIVAREGDEITVGGGMGNGIWYSCAPVTVTKPAS
jgi:hypothetical protein